MTITDWIATASLLVASASLFVALFALKESKRTNRISLVEKRAAISDAFAELAIAALCDSTSIGEDTIRRFEPHAREAEKYLPEALALEVESFYEDCQYLLFAQTLQEPEAPDIAARVAGAATRVHRNALRIKQSLLSLVRQVADA